MSSQNSTLWMGNIENWMSQSYLHNLLKSANIYPNRIILKNYQNKRGCAFLEFFSKEMAEYVLTEYNNKEINGIKLKFNKVHSLQQKYNNSKITKFTVSQKKIINIFFLYYQLFVGNIDKSISFDEVKNYFYSKFSSIISAKLIVNQQTGRSKGYAFFEFTNYKEFIESLKLKGQLIFGKQTLVLNSAKNKYNFDEDDKINQINNIHNTNDEIKSLNSSMISSLTQPLSSAETGISSVRNSKEYNSSSNNNNNNHTFTGDKTKPEINNNCINKFDDLQLQIKDSLKKLSEQYYLYDNKPSLFNYYCSPFIYKSYYRRDEIINNNKYENCPFEIYKKK